MFRGILPVGLFLALALPYLLSNNTLSTLLPGSRTGELSSDNVADAPAAEAPLSAADTAAAAEPSLEDLAARPAPVDEALYGSPPQTGSSAESKPRLEGPPVEDMLEIFRFTITPPWILQHWARTTTGTPLGALQGYRVPLVTGTRVDDLAGSLTYYFSAQQQLETITFHGTTGDYRRLEEFLVGTYDFQPRTSDNPGEILLVATRFNKVISWCKIRPLSVVTADAPHLRYKIDLRLQRPPR